MEISSVMLHERSGLRDKSRENRDFLWPEMDNLKREEITLVVSYAANQKNERQLVIGNVYY